MTKVFCQNCFENTGRTLSRSVHEINTSGGCSACGSFAVISQEVVEAARRIPTHHVNGDTAEAVPAQTVRRWIRYNSDYIQTEWIRAFLLIHDPESERWWDGCYFEYHLDFITACLPIGSYQRGIQTGFLLILENQDGERRHVNFEVELRKV